MAVNLGAETVSCSLCIMYSDLCEEQLSKATYASALEACSEWKTQMWREVPSRYSHRTSRQRKREYHGDVDAIGCARDQRVEDVMSLKVIEAYNSSNAL